MEEHLSQDPSPTNGKHRPDSLFSISGSPEEMRVEEERLLSKGYTRVPSITPDDELLDAEYKWVEPPKISSLFKTEVTLTWREPE
jgi:hypothetical protein